MIGPQRVSGLLPLLPLALIAACGDNPQAPDEDVLVQGVVMDIDRGMPAQGVRVALVSDGSIASTEPTGTDGVFSMRVPGGTVWQTVTDDFVPVADLWIPMINADYPGVVIDGPRSDLLVHACPASQTFPQDANDLPAGSGGAAAWNAYLADCQDPTYPQFDIPSIEDANGTVIFVAWESVGNTCGNTTGISATLDDPAFTMGYLDGNKVWFTPDREACYLQPATAVATDASGLGMAFAGPALTAQEVTLSVTDTDGSRGLQYPDLDVPVRPGAITVVFAGRIDGQGGTHVVDCLCDCGGAPPGIVCE